MKRGPVGTKRKKTLPVTRSVPRRVRVRTRSRNTGSTAKKGRSKRPTRAKAGTSPTAARKASRPGKTRARAATPVKPGRPKRLRPRIFRRKPAPLPKKRKQAAPKRMLRMRTPGRVKPRRRAAARPKIRDFLTADDLPESGAPAERIAAPAVPEPGSTRVVRSRLAKLYLTVRDPHWLYAHWDLPRTEQFRHNALSMDRHLILRVHDAAGSAGPVAEHHVHPESLYWFVHVETPGAAYRVELGYYRSGRRWKSLCFSAPQRTPPAQVAAPTPLTFVTVPFQGLPVPAKTAGPAPALSHHALEAALAQIRPRHREPAWRQTQPDGEAAPPEVWSPSLTFDPAASSWSMTCANPLHGTEGTAGFDLGDSSPAATSSWPRAL